ncbi:hypothetical protein K6U06_18850 [Acidiferrimicrobium sp. IK]|jgi:SAF domain|uniref:SAF domain-containing protein n=1 Tax=Acidiferrimicrobium sp. IK TaxID=2871700 RepID=UPI0021CB55C0|nr:SAF domain-containing protein [Acidiferrimicrobium sp. IK]MCU4186434.1 hypothetical protein [Acidiferrimicrobium sp. IK]
MTVASERASTSAAPTTGYALRHRRLGSRWTVGHVAPVVLAVLAAVFVLAALQDRGATVLVPVASAPIPAGAAVNGSDTRLVKVHRSDAAVVSGLLPSGDLRAGWVAVSRIEAGEPVTRGAVTQGPVGASGLGSMSIPVPVDRADGGAIAAGDRVDVIVSSGSGASYVAQGLTVVGVSPTKTSGVLAGATSDFYITVAVDRPTALRLTAALGTSGSTGSTGALEVVRSTGETGSASAGSYRPPAPGGGSGS